MLFNAHINYDKSTPIHCRVLDAATRTWYTGAAWTATEALAEQLPLTEKALTDPDFNLYAASLTVLDGDYVLEYVVTATGEVVGSDSYYHSNAELAQSVVDAILGNSIASGVMATSITVTSEDIRISRGDVKTLSFSFGSAWDCTGGKRIFFTLKSTRTQTPAILDAEATITVEATATGHVDLAVADTDTVGKFWYEFERRDADGTSNPGTIQRGRLTIEQDVRQEAPAP